MNKTFSKDDIQKINDFKDFLFKFSTTRALALRRELQKHGADLLLVRSELSKIARAINGIDQCYLVWRGLSQRERDSVLKIVHVISPCERELSIDSKDEIEGLKHLEKLGFVSLQLNPAGVLVTLTDEGQELMEWIRKSFRYAPHILDTRKTRKK